MLKYVKIRISVWLIKKRTLYLFYRLKNRDMKRVCTVCHGDGVAILEDETLLPCDKCDHTGVEIIDFLDELKKIIEQSKNQSEKEDYAVNQVQELIYSINK